ELSHSLSQHEALRARDVIAGHVKELNARLAAAEAALLEFKRTNQVEVLKDDVEGLLAQRRELADLLLEIAAASARITRAEKELQLRSQTMTSTRSIESDPAMMEAAKSARGDASSMRGLEVKSENPNPVFETLDQDLAYNRAELAALEKKRTHLVDVNKLGARQIERLNALYEKQAALARLELDYDLAKKAYSTAAEQFENATLQIASRSAE